MSPVIYEYEEILIGKEQKYTKEIFDSSPEENERITLEVFRYAFDTYLRWDIDYLRKYLTLDVIEQLQLTSLLKYIRFPSELNKKQNMDYLVDVLYPGKVKMDFRTSVVDTYKKVIKNTKDNKLPKGFFAENTGLLRANICLQYILTEYKVFETIEDLYGFFACSDGSKFLKKYRLYDACNDFYDYPLEFLHNALPKSQQNDFLFHYYMFRIKYGEMKRLEKVSEQK